MSAGWLISRRLVNLGAPLCALLAGASLVGFISISFNPGSPAFRWAQMPVSFVIQADGSADVPDLSDHAAVRLGLRAWEDDAGSAIDFQEDLAADATRTDFEATDIHVVMWDEDGSSGLFPPGSGIIALTPLTASTIDGSILDADIVFNGGLQFGTSPGVAFDVQAVATHEAGHMLGFDHAGGPLTTMFSAIQAGQMTARSLSRDEESGAVHVYPSGTPARGRIAGTVTRQGGTGLRFPQVVAVDEATGELAGAAVGTAGGDYALEALRPGTYRLYVESLDGPLAPGDTIALRGQTVDLFDTTWFPGGTVSVSAGQTTPATWAAAGDGALNASTSSGIETIAPGNRTLIVTGTGLANVIGARVTGTGVTVTGFTPLPPDRLRVDVSAGAGAGIGLRCLELTDQQGRVALVTGAVEVVGDVPVVTQAAPATLDAAGGELLAVTGTGFAAGSQVVVGGQLCPQVAFISASRLDCLTPPSPGLATPVDVVVIRPDGREGRLQAAVTYEANPVPSSIDPAFGPVAGGTIHRIIGTGFAQGVQVTVGGNPATVLSVTGTEIRITLPAGTAGPADVSVVFGNSEGLLPGGLTYVNAAPPVIGSFSPANGPTTGGTAVTLTGSGFPADAEVTFGGSPATGVVVTGATSITCFTPAHAAGAAEVRVRDPSTQLVGVAAASFTFDAGLAPISGGGGGGGDDGCRLGRAGGPGPLAVLAVVALLVGLRRPGRR